MTKAPFSPSSLAAFAALILSLSGLLTPLPAWCAPEPPATDPGKSQPVFEGERTYQGPGGDVHFTVAGTVQSQPVMSACLTWKPVDPKSLPSQRPCDQPLTVRLIKEIQAPPGALYAVTIPRNLSTPPKATESLLFGLVPIAELVISSKDGAAAGWPAIRVVGITSRGLAAFMAILAILLATVVLYRFARYLNVPGPETPDFKKDPRGFFLHSLRGFSVLLRIISTATGWASLSQLQIILWTFVVGAGAVYVMSLTGSLIPISAGTLALLGIAGGATVLTEIKTSQQSQPPQSLPLPGAVTGLKPVGPAGETDLVIQWWPPNGVTALTTYLVEYADPGAPALWLVASRALRGTRLRIVGLKAATPYQIRVSARNAAGTGPENAISATTSPKSASTSPNPSTMRLSMRDDPKATAIFLEWAGPPDRSLVLQKRLHDSDADWTRVDLPKDPSQTSMIVRGLAPSTDYDFRIKNEKANEDWSGVTTFTTGVRVPKWSDIVTDTDRPAEIDVTRVQMLFFTVISAGFVALNIVDTGTIPPIDSTYVTLMGISNGVYVTAKFVRP